jgi:hypothetical protein
MHNLASTRAVIVCSCDGSIDPTQMAASVDVRITTHAPIDHCWTMSWKIIRLELAYSGEFPRGSVGRSYLIRLPLTNGGSIDDDQLGSNPKRATVRRFWASEPDSTGYITRNSSGYAIKDDGGSSDITRHVQFLDKAVHPGGRVMLTEPDGSEMSFRVAAVS